MTEKEITTLIQEIHPAKQYKFFIAPNYEDRSLGLLNHVLELANTSNIKVIVLKLQSANYKVDILDDLKINLFTSAIKSLEGAEISFFQEEIAYPDKYSPNTIDRLAKEHISQSDNVIFDLSSLPKSIIVDICKTFHTDICQSFVFAYSSPKSYPQIRYPQAVGEMKGMLSHLSISKLLHKYTDGTLITFPNDLGYSGQLISDQVARITSFEQYLFVYMRRRAPLQAYNAMAGNKNLLTEAYKEWRNNVVTHFSIQDGYRKLQKIIENIISKVGSKDRAGYLVLLAPFGPKPLIVGCYFLSKLLENEGFFSEIVQESSFQYSSVYSIGVGKTYLFEIEPTDKFINKNLLNQIE